MKTGGLYAVTLIAILTSVGSWAEQQRVRRMSDVVCGPRTTKIIPPNYYRHNATGWCKSAVEQLSNDYYNVVYRRECQRWLGGSLPDSVATAQLTYCFEFPNGTASYRMAICCSGNYNGIRCFSGMKNTKQYHDYSSLNYIINYENDLETCGESEVCQTRYAFHGSNGRVDNITTSKGCVKRDECAAVKAAGTCSSCRVAEPVCAWCCNESFCNYETQFHHVHYIVPAVCPTVPTVTDPCLSNPCQNAAVCKNQWKGGITNKVFVCFCPIEYTGVTCSERRSTCLSDDRCLNGGTCYDYSDLVPGDYRCDCPAPFVGDRCEMQSNLTCASHSSYRTIGPGTKENTNCSFLALSSSGHPETNYVAYQLDFVPNVCKVNRPEVSLIISFEVKSCRRGATLSWFYYHHCCQNRSLCTFGTNPCLNGGTCYDWSETGEGKYRCECPPLFVGDNCEIGSNLTCSATDRMYATTSTINDYASMKMNCTSRAWLANGRPQYSARDIVNDLCRTYTRKHWNDPVFRQGVDGQVPADMVQYEMKSCDWGLSYSRATFHFCCPTCVSCPCQNGGYCVQLEYNRHVCRCRFGFNGVNCENKLSTCTLSGEPHYRTFDLKMFDYQGTCKYNLATPCTQEPGLPYFRVFARNENRNGITTVAYPSYVEVVYGDVIVRLARRPPSGLGIAVDVTVDGNYVQIPYDDDDFEISYNGPNAHFVSSGGLSVDFDGDWVITVSVPADYAGKMCGLCGNNDNNPDNDLTLANGSYVGHLATGGSLFGNSHVVDDHERAQETKCESPTPAPLCDGQVPDDYRTLCGYTNNVTGPLAPCVSRLKPGLADSYYENCIMDACYTDGMSVCNSVKVFVQECMASGIYLPCHTWMSLVGCGNNSSTSGLCPPGMVYRCAASACQPTCADPNATDSCALPNVDACVCTDGQLLHNGTCTSQCPAGCIDSRRQLRAIGEFWPGANCTTMRCVSCEDCRLGTRIVSSTNCVSTQICTDRGICARPATPSTVEPTTESTESVTYTSTSLPDTTPSNLKTSQTSLGLGSTTADTRRPPTLPPCKLSEWKRFWKMWKRVQQQLKRLQRERNNLAQRCRQRASYRTHGPETTTSECSQK